MRQRATTRPGTFSRPAHWSVAPPPEPAPPREDTDELSPTRYGDWVRKGLAIDF